MQLYHTLCPPVYEVGVPVEGVDAVAVDVPVSDGGVVATREELVRGEQRQTAHAVIVTWGQVTQVRSRHQRRRRRGQWK